MSITQYSTGVSGLGSSVTTLSTGIGGTGSGAIAKGDLLLCWLRVQRTGTSVPTLPTISDNASGGGSWVPLTSAGFVLSTTNPDCAEMAWYKVANAADVTESNTNSMQVTCGWTGSSNGTSGAQFVVDGYTGFTGTATLDPAMSLSANSGGSSTTVTSQLIPLGLSTTAQAAVSLIVAGATWNGTSGITSPALQDNGSGNFPNLTATHVSAGAYITGWALSTAAPTSSDKVNFTWSGTAHGACGIAAVFYDKQITGTGSGSFSFGGTATGTVIIPGTATGSFGLSGSALATDSGAGAGGFSFSGSATGTVLLPSTAAGAFSLSGAGTGVVKLPSTGSGGFSFGGSATAGALSWTGVGTGVFELTGRAIGTLEVSAPPITDAVTIYAYSFTTDDAFTKLLNELPLKDITWSQNLNTPGNFGGTLNLADPKVQEMQKLTNSVVVDKTLIVIDSNGTILWAGLLIGNPYDSTTRLMKLSGREGWCYWESILQAFDYSIGPNGGAGEFWSGNPDFAYNIAAQVILDSLGKDDMILAETAIFIDIESPTTPQAQSQSFPISSIQFVDDIVTQLSQGGYETGFDFALDWAWAAGPGSFPLPIVTLSYPARERPQSETGLVLDAGAPGVSYTYARTGGTGQANRQYGTGGTATTLVSDQSVDPSDGYGLFEGTTNPQNVSTQQALDAATSGELAVTQFPPVVATFTMPLFSESLSIIDLRMGDDMAIIIPPDERFPDGVVGLTLRLTAISCKVPEEGVSTMTLTMTTVPGLAPVANPPE